MSENTRDHAPDIACDESDKLQLRADSSDHLTQK